MENLKVSVITVSYNSVRTIRQTILSVLNQSYRNIEYIIVDGQSSDGTKDIIEQYGTAIAHYISEPDDGLYDAMNKGIRCATGDLIGMINSDDWYECEAVEKAVACFLKTGAGVVHGKLCTVYENGRRVYSEKKPLDHLWYEASPVRHPTVFVKREIYQKYGLFNTMYKIAADVDLILRFYTSGVRFAYIDDVISNFRDGGISSLHYMKGCEEKRHILLSYVEQCPNREYALSQIERKYALVKLIYIMEKNPQKICDFIRKNLLNKEDHITIFGTGYWGRQFQKVFETGKISVRMFADNDKLLWHTNKDGIIVQNPDKLRDEAGCVLIAVENGAEEIDKQLSGLQNEKLKWITLDDVYRGVID